MKEITAEEFSISSTEIMEALKEIFETIINRVGEQTTIIGIADGAMPIMAIFQRFCDEMPSNKRKPMLASIRASSYLGEAPGKITLSDIPSIHLTHKQKVVLIDDVIDSGNTMRTIAKYLAESRKAKEVIGAALCLKGDVPFWADEAFIGFKLPKNKFLVGFGMDYKGEFRIMPEIRPMTQEEKDFADKHHPMPVEEPVDHEVVDVPAPADAVG